MRVRGSLSVCPVSFRGAGLMAVGRTASPDGRSRRARPSPRRVPGSFEYSWLNASRAALVRGEEVVDEGDQRGADRGVRLPCLVERELQLAVEVDQVLVRLAVEGPVQCLAQALAHRFRRPDHVRVPLGKVGVVHPPEAVQVVEIESELRTLPDIAEVAVGVRVGSVSGAVGVGGCHQ